MPINFQENTASQKAKNMTTTVYTILLLLLFVSACDALFCQETKLKTRQVEETDECASFFVCQSANPNDVKTNIVTQVKKSYPCCKNLSCDPPICTR